MRPAAWLAIACFAFPARAAELTVAALFEVLAKARPAHATFQERKHIALLDKPIDSSGELSFTPPDRLEKRTLKPRAESVIAERGQLVLERAGKRLTMSLADNPGAATLLEGLRATLAGDLNALTRSYSVALEGGLGGWTLSLKPLDPAGATLVERIEISGAQSTVRRVEIRQSDGDRSVMTIAP